MLPRDCVYTVHILCGNIALCYTETQHSYDEVAKILSYVSAAVAAGMMQIGLLLL